MKYKYTLEIDIDPGTESADWVDIAADDLTEVMQLAIKSKHGLGYIQSVGQLQFTPDIVEPVAKIADCPQSKAFRAYIVGSLLSGAAGADDNTGVLVEKAFRLTDEVMRKL